MTLILTVPKVTHTDFTPRITVIGVGGGGTNAVNNMIALNLPGVDFIVANTDAQSLQLSRADKRIQLGPHITQGNGAGGRPEVGKASADEAADDLAQHLENTHMVFITAGMGGGTGTGAAPVIARMARERNILTIGVVTKPFGFEGKKRMRLAEEGIAELQAYVDTLIVIPNQNLFKVATDRTGWKEAFEMADNVLYMGVRGVTDLMVQPGLVNLDYADIRTIMAVMGKAMMGTGEADGEDRAIRAAEAAISNPLLEDTNMKGARGLLINITGGSDITLFEMDQAANRIREEVDEDANIMVGMALDETLNGRMRISVVATGIDSEAPGVSQQPKLQIVGGGAAENLPFPAHAQPAQLQPAAPSAAPQAFAPSPAAAPAAPSPISSQGAGYIPQPPAKPLLSAAYANPAGMSEFDLAAPEAKSVRPAPPRTEPAAEAPKRASLFSRVFGGAPAEPQPEPAPRAATHREPVLNHPIRAEPEFRSPEPAREVTREPARAAVRPAQVDEIALEIPAFLRRSNS
jgi:cell division protein FtsZ